MQTKFLTKISAKLFSPTGAIVILSFLAFGIMAPWLGFYWDDWLLMWLSHQLGPESLQQLSTYHVRPLSGWVLWLGAEVFGEQPFGWHIIIWLFRLASGLLIYWFGVLLWPKSRRAIVFASLIFILYPGYRHQLVSVNTSYHIAALVMFLLSICLMIISIKKESGGKIYLIFSVALSLSSMLTSEYIYGLELVRPLIIFLLVSREEVGKSNIKETLDKWSPFLLQIVGVYAWRFSISDNLNYPVLVFQDISNGGFPVILRYSYQALRDMYEVVLTSWASVFHWPNLGEFGKYSFIFLAASVCFTFIYTLILLRRHNHDKQPNLRAQEMIFLGLAGLGLAGIPFWITDLNVTAVFPDDRFALPMTFGATIAIVGALEILFRRRGNLLIILYAFAVAMAMGFHIQNSVNFYRDWKTFTVFNTQLHWRIPNIKDNTVFLSPELPLQFSTDDSLTAALSWGFNLPVEDGKMRLNLSYIDFRLLDQGKGLENSTSISNKYMFFRFEGSSNEMLLLEFSPPACLRIYHPEYDYLNPQVSPELRDILSYSNMELIISSNNSSIVLPKTLFGTPVEKTWCYYFQKADLARQNENWDEVVRIGDIAFSIGDSPNHAAERLPFIEGYAISGNLVRAKELSMEAIKINPKIQEALCLIWNRYEERSDLSEKNAFTIRKIQSSLACK